MSKRTISEILRGMIEIANANVDSDLRLKRLMDYFVENWVIDLSALYLPTSEKNHLKLWVQNEGGILEAEKTYPLGEGLVGKAALDKKPIIIKNRANVATALAPFLNDYAALALIPLVDEKSLFGVLLFLTRDVEQWNEEIMNTFSIIGIGLTGALRNLQLINEHQKMIDTCTRSTLEKETILRELSLLYELSQALMFTIKLEDLLRITLSAVTMGKGLGFNRAMLFMVNESKKLLEGKLGIGPDSPEEAGRVWKELSENGKGFLEWIKSQPRWKLNKPSSLIDQVVREIKIPLKKDNGLLAQAVLEEKIFLQNDPFQDPIIAQKIFSRIPPAIYALVPIRGKRSVIGVIMVDNLYNQKPITEYDLRLLTMLANQAGLAIENSCLFENLETVNNELRVAQEKLIQNEKFATLGMMSSVVVHEIKNPLVAVGGFARRLEKSACSPTEKTYAKIIVKEVERLEKTLTDILIFTKEPKLDFQENNLNEILEDTLTLLSENFANNEIQVEKSLSPSLPLIYCDSHQLKQVFINLFYNAIQTMEDEGGTLMIKTYSRSEDNMVIIEVTDTGKGIPPEVLNNIFNPFFTTKDKGVGLGLSIVHKIISYHQGTIEARNNLEKGVTFTIKLPLKWNGIPTRQK